jgi:hypothetical protein
MPTHFFSKSEDKVLTGGLSTMYPFFISLTLFLTVFGFINYLWDYTVYDEIKNEF